MRNQTKKIKKYIRLSFHIDYLNLFILVRIKNKQNKMQTQSWKNQKDEKLKLMIYISYKLFFLEGGVLGGRGVGGSGVLLLFKPPKFSAFSHSLHVFIKETIITLFSIFFFFFKKGGKMTESEKATNETNMLSKSYFDVLGICCTSEVVLVEKILKNLEGVKEVSVIVTTKTVIVIHDSLIISQLQIGKLHT